LELFDFSNGINCILFQGGLAIGVPGEIKGLHEAWLRYGIVAWADLVQPSIQLCEDGFELNAETEFALQYSEQNIREDSELRYSIITI
jgi:gamma-glutamyltranspeptidase/glutathione hydrolase/leukotriene-C4 hydrolase